MSVDYESKVVDNATYVVVASLTDLKNLIGNATAGDTITLGFDYAYIEKFDAGLEDGIVIDKDITIDGNGSVISGSDVARLFNVTNGFTLTLNNVTLTNGSADNGGAVYVNSGAALNADAVEFNDNTAVYRGGAIWSAGTVNIENSAFDSNNITHRNENKDYGGAAIFSSGELNVNNSRFTNDLKNYVVRSGDANNPQLIDGVILITGDAYIRNSYFENNSGTYGGVITALPISSTDSPMLYVENCEFVNNLAYSGAAIYVGSGDVAFEIDNCTFVGNNATGIGSYGYTSAEGAISLTRGAHGNISDSKFINNTATVGGAIDVSAVRNPETLIVDIDNCLFENNTATGSSLREAVGGAVRINTANVTVSVSDSNFTDNVATDSGSAIYNVGKLALSGNKITGDGVVIESSGTITCTET